MYFLWEQGCVRWSVPAMPGGWMIGAMKNIHSCEYCGSGEAIGHCSICGAGLCVSCGPHCWAACVRDKAKPEPAALDKESR